MRIPTRPHLLLSLGLLFCTVVTPRAFSQAPDETLVRENERLQARVMDLETALAAALARIADLEKSLAATASGGSVAVPVAGVFGEAGTTLEPVLCRGMFCYG